MLSLATFHLLNYILDLLLQLISDCFLFNNLEVSFFFFPYWST